MFLASFTYDFDLAAKSAEIATFALVSTGGGLYLYGAKVPIRLRVAAMRRVYDGPDERFHGQELLWVQVQVTSRTRNSALITKFGYIPTPNAAKRRVMVAREKVDEFREFLGSALPQGGFEVPGHTTSSLAGSIPCSAVPPGGVSVVLIVAGRPFIEKVP